MKKLKVTKIPISKPVEPNACCEEKKYISPDYYSFVVVQDIHERDNIPCKLRQNGMIAVVVEDNYAQYQIQTTLENSKCSNSSWIRVSNGTSVLDGSNLFIFYTREEAELYLLNPLRKTGQVIYIVTEDKYYKIKEEGLEDMIPTQTFDDNIVVGLPTGFTFGKYKNGDIIYSQGKTPIEVILDATKTTMYPTFTAPSLNLSIPTTSREVGSSFSFTATLNFNRGSIRGNKIAGVWDENAPQNPRAGQATSYIINGTDVFPGNTRTITGTTMLGDNTITGSVTFEEGPQPIDSDNNNYGNPLPGGSMNTSNRFKGLYSIFFGAAESNVTNYRNLPSSALIEGVYSGQFSTGSYLNFYIVIPADKRLTSVTDVETQNLELLPYFVQSNIIVKDAGDVDRNYKLYKMSNKTAYTPAHTFKFKIE